MEVYKTLLKIMGEKHLSIPDVARMCDLSDSTVRGIITRKQKNIALEVAFKISEGLNVSLEYLNSGDDKTVLDIKEYPTMAKYRRLTPKEQNRVDDLIDRALSGQPTGDVTNTQKKLAPTDEGELDKAIIDMIIQLQLSPYELQRLVDFAKGLAAARTEPPSGEHPDR